MSKFNINETLSARIAARELQKSVSKDGGEGNFGELFEQWQIETARAATIPDGPRKQAQQDVADKKWASLSTLAEEHPELLARLETAMQSKRVREEDESTETDSLAA